MRSGSNFEMASDRLRPLVVLGRRRSVIFFVKDAWISIWLGYVRVTISHVIRDENSRVILCIICALNGANRNSVLTKDSAH